MRLLWTFLGYFKPNHDVFLTLIRWFCARVVTKEMFSSNLSVGLQERPQLTVILVIVSEHHVSPDVLILSVCDELKDEMFLYVFKVRLLH